MALLCESPNQNIKPPLGPRHCRIRSLLIQSNLFDFDKEKTRKQRSLSDFNNENPKQHIKGLSDFRKELNPKKQSNKKRSSFRNLLEAHRTFTKSLSTPCFTQFAVRTLNSSKKDNGPSIQLISTNKPQGINELIAEATDAIKLGLHPIENQGERSQVFMLKNQANEPVAVFKTMDCAATAAREVAAYVLDYDGFSGVTPSAIVKISHPDLNKTNDVSASLQRFIPHCCDGRAMGPSQFLVGPVHCIGILDIRVLNIDRHTGNILVKKKINASDTIVNEVYDLMPIDHELCLPEELEDPYFEWQSWRQALVPFSDYEKEYVASLDPFKDADLLRSELPQIKEAAIRILILCTVFLKKAVSAGLCLSDIGDMMTAEFDKPSMLETLCRRAAGLICIEKAIEETDESQYEDDNDDSHDTQFEMDIVDIPFSNNKTKVIDGLAKAISLPNTEFNYAGKKVSFMMLSEEEWLKFLKRFEEILPPAFEARTNMSLKRKLGTSCKF